MDIYKRKKKKYGIHLIFGHTGNIFSKDGKEYKIRNRTNLMVQSLRSELHYPPVDIVAEAQHVLETKEMMKALKVKKNKEC